jgi:hypothetical protein
MYGRGKGGGDVEKKMVRLRDAPGPSRTGGLSCIAFQDICESGDAALRVLQVL